MLYEVITGLDVVVVPTNRPVMRFDDDDVIYFNEELKNNAICDEIKRVVITSYSIHYTKLYEETKNKAVRTISTVM